jgi:hypothetical protein
MRTLLVIAVAATALLFGTRAGQAYEGPWCAQYTIGADAFEENCSMRSFEQCLQEVLAGNRGTCVRNLRYRGTYGDEKPRQKRKRRVEHD